MAQRHQDVFNKDEIEKLYGATYQKRNDGTQAPAMYDYTAIENDPNSVWNQVRWGGAGWKNDLKNWDSLTPEYQAAMSAVAAQKGGWEDNRTGSFGGSSGGYGGNYGGNYGGSGGYKDSYAGQIKSLTDQIMNRGAFSYDVNKDPLYAQYADQYTRLGQRAMDDTLAKISARTGGLASSYAATAGNQAYNNYMQELSNKVPELYKLAYEMYSDDYNRDVNNLGLLRGLSSDEYNRYANERSYADSRSDLAYQRAWNESERDYSRGRDTIGDQRYAQEYADSRGDVMYSRGLTSQKDARAEIDAILAAGGYPSDALIAASGYSPEYVSTMQGYYAPKTTGGYWPVGDGNNTIDLSTDIGKEVAAIPGAISKYLTKWDDMDPETKYMALVTSGVDTGDALRLSNGGDRWQVQQTLSELSGPASNPYEDALVENYIKLVDAGVMTEEQARKELEKIDKGG